MRTKTHFADAIKAATDPGKPPTGLNKMEWAVLCAIAQHQPIDCAGLADVIGREVSREGGQHVEAMQRCDCTKDNAYMQHSLLALVVIRSSEFPMSNLST